MVVCAEKACLLHKVEEFEQSGFTHFSDHCAKN